MKANMISKPAPCPWCRTNEHLWIGYTDNNCPVVCCDCGARGPSDEHVANYEIDTIEKAWAAWDAMQVDCFSDLDQLDKDAIDSAIANRQRAPLPPGFGSLRGRILAEICRGWLEMIGKWNGPIQTDEGDETHERVNPTDSPKR